MNREEWLTERTEHYQKRCGPFPRWSDERLRKIKLLSSQLAKFFNPDPEMTACACMGLECCNAGCAAWWKLVLMHFSREDVQKVFRFYFLAKDL